MHLIIAIALGVFGGLWLFVRWGEWREKRAERKMERDVQRAVRQNALDLERAWKRQEEERSNVSATPPPPRRAYAALAAPTVSPGAPARHWSLGLTVVMVLMTAIAMGAAINIVAAIAP